MGILTELMMKASSWLTLLPRISLRNLFEIAIISFLVYEILFWIKNTRAWTLLKGLLTIMVFAIVAVLLRLDTIVWILKNITTIAVTAFLVVFQPELRKALEQLGSQNLLSGILAQDDGKSSQEFNDRTVNELVRATFEMAKVKTGALMVIERGTSLKEIERTGIEISGLVTSQLLINIFEHNTPLHDGAVVIRGNRVAAATCYLPLSDNMSINKALGTRHRAAVGVSETTDSLTIVVSEETGRVSVAEGGMLRSVPTAEALRNILSGLMKEEPVSSNRFKIWKGRLINGKKLTNNLKLKILSVFLAFFVWLAVTNISNPDVTATKEVPLEVLNEDVLSTNGKTYELIDNRTTVTVAYKVRTLDAGSISASDFRAYIDLADMYEPTGAVPVKVDVKNNKVDAVTAKPMVIRVTTEDVQQKKFDLTAYTEGKTESGYREGTVNIVPTSIYVSGPESQVGRISTVGITIRLDGANSDLSGTAQIQCFDANRNKITLDDRVTLSRSEADYTLSILKVKTLGLNFETEGRVADGYRFTGIESNVNSVDVVGLKSDLAEINAINIPKSELNMDGASADKEVIIDLNKYLPENVELADSNSKIHVTLKVEPLETRTIELKTSKIRQVGASSRYSYQYDRDAIRLSIKGLQEDLDQLTDDDLEAEVDVSDMGPGTHPGTVTFELGAAYELVSQDDLQIIVHDREPGDTVPAPTQEETGSSTRETTAAESSSGASNHTTAAETSH